MLLCSARLLDGVVGVYSVWLLCPHHPNSPPRHERRDSRQFAGQTVYVPVANVRASPSRRSLDELGWLLRLGYVERLNVEKCG